MTGLIRLVLPLLFLLLVQLAPAAEADDAGIGKQLDVLQKIRDYNVSFAESTLRNVSFLIAFLGGILSFLAPCAVALFPAFLAFTARSGQNITLATLAFFAGFSTMFIALGVALTALGRVSFTAFQGDISFVVQAAGAMLIGLGIMMFFGRGFSFIRLRSRLPGDAPGFFLFGALFAIGWSACIGPIIAGIFIMAAVFHNYVYTAFLLFFYSLGLAIPMFAAAFAYDRFNFANSRLARGFVFRIRIGRRELMIASANLISGLLLVFIGLFFIINKGTAAITSADLFRTSGLAERLSNAVLQNTGLFSLVAGIVLAVFVAVLAYFIKKQRVVKK